MVTWNFTITKPGIIPREKEVVVTCMCSNCETEFEMTQHESNCKFFAKKMKSNEYTDGDYGKMNEDLSISNIKCPRCLEIFPAGEVVRSIRLREIVTVNKR